MSTVAAVETAWESVWEAEDIQEYTAAIHTYSITQDSEREISQLYHEKQINFIEALTTRSVIHATTGRKEYQFTVTVNYYRHKDTKGVAWKAVRDFFDTLYSSVSSEMTQTWGSTVDYWKPQAEPAQISETTIDNEAVWIGTYSYTGFKVA